MERLLTNSFSLEPLPWDSQFLGFPVARIRPTQNGATSLAHLLAQSRADGLKLLYINLSPIDEANALLVKQSGGWLADRKLTYELELAALAAVAPAGVAIGLTTDFMPQLEELAWQSGEFSRFRLDRNFEPTVFQDLYSHWLRTALTGSPGKVVLVAQEATLSSPMGLLVLGFRAQQAMIELVAVDAPDRARGIGQALLHAACARAQTHGCTTMQVVTQRDNQRACRFYEQFGFQLVDEVALYHLWL